VWQANEGLLCSEEKRREEKRREEKRREEKRREEKREAVPCGDAACDAAVEQNHQMRIGNVNNTTCKVRVSLDWSVEGEDLECPRKKDHHSCNFAVGTAKGCQALGSRCCFSWQLLNVEPGASGACPARPSDQRRE
jgi:hypothetical protein